MTYRSVPQYGESRTHVCSGWVCRCVHRFSRGIGLLGFMVAAVGRSRSSAALALVLGVTGWIASAGCSSSCTLRGTFGLHVVAIDGSSAAAICNATVTAQDGDYSETLVPIASADAGEPCAYVGALERPGTYTVTVAAGARSKSVEGVRVTGGGDACAHVVSQNVTVTVGP